MEDKLNELRDAFLEYGGFHDLERDHSLGAASLLSATHARATHSCTCGGWAQSYLPNRAGAEAALLEHALHRAEMGERLTQAVDLFLESSC